jgi:glycine/D-amino acid oxidase-like deaminating enzyme
MGITANTTAKLTSQHGLLYNYLTNNFSKDFAKKYLEANEEGIKLAKNIIEKENIECDFEKQDAYVYTNIKTELKKIKEEVDTVHVLGGDTEFVTKLELPLDVLGAIKFKNQAKFHPLKYLISILNYLEKTNCNLYENSKVIDVKKKDNGYDVITENYKVSSKYVIIATHYPIVNFPGIHFLKMYQDRSYVIAIETKEKLFDGMYISSKSPGYSFRTVKYNDKELLLIIGGAHKTGDKAVNIESVYIDLENYAKSIYPDARVLYKWSTEDCISLDKVPYIGDFSKLMPNVFVATGFNKWGMTSSHIAAQIILDKIQGRRNKYEEIFSPARFEPIKNREEVRKQYKAGCKIINTK